MNCRYSIAKLLSAIKIENGKTACLFPKNGVALSLGQDHGVISVGANSFAVLHVGDLTLAAKGNGVAFSVDGLIPLAPAGIYHNGVPNVGYFTDPVFVFVGGKMSFVPPFGRLSWKLHVTLRLCSKRYKYKEGCSDELTGRHISKYLWQSDEHESRTC